MIAGKDYIYTRKDVDGHVFMFLDEQCSQPYVNSAMRKKVIEFMKNTQTNTVEVYYENIRINYED